jgi:uncharacterized DUF497 family protein
VVDNEANLDHVARHDVSRAEAEEAILNDPVELKFAYADDEPRWSIIGRTDSGRFLVVAFTERDLGIRVVTAFDATKRDEAVYFEQKGE